MITNLKLCCLLLLSCYSAVFAFEGKVVSIADGDTLTVLVTPDKADGKPCGICGG